MEFWLRKWVSEISPNIRVPTEDELNYIGSFKRRASYLNASLDFAVHAPGDHIISISPAQISLSA